MYIEVGKRVVMCVLCIPWKMINKKPTSFGTFEVPHAARPPETDIGTSNWVEALQILTHLIKLTY